MKKDYILQYYIINNIINNYLHYDLMIINNQNLISIKTLNNFFDKNDTIKKIIENNTTKLDIIDIYNLIDIRSAIIIYLNDNYGILFI